MPRINLAKLLSILVFILGASGLSAATVTYAVGTCEPGVTSFKTISAALAATPQPNVVLVCPGTYREQVQITYPVTLQGVSFDGSAQAIIAPPPNGLVVNATDDLGDPIAAQLYIWIDPTAVESQIQDIVIEGTGNGITAFPPYVVGIFVQNTPATINHVTTRNQTGNGHGVGIWLEGGLLLPAITIENSSIHNFDLYGTWTQTNVAAGSQLTATISGNDVNGNFSGKNPGSIGMLINSGSTNTISGNVVAGLAFGIWTEGTATGTISGNTLLDDSIGILLDADGVSTTGNKIYASCPAGAVAGSCRGIQINTLVPAVQNNTIINSPIGIDFNCVANPNVHSNTITDGTTGLAQVPVGTTSTNTFYGVSKTKTSCAAGTAH
jgi:parallel beta-helix repeat protein